MDLRELIQRLATLEQRVEFLEAENASLKEELAKYRTPKNSINSSLPPSKDQYSVAFFKGKSVNVYLLLV